MPAISYIQVHAYTSEAQIPLEDVAITITDDNGGVIAMRLTNESGQIDPVPISVPNAAESQTPNSGTIPFTTVNLLASLENYIQIEVENIQLFAGTTTYQNLELIPLSELPGSWNQAEVFPTPPQNL